MNAIPTPVADALNAALATELVREFVPIDGDTFALQSVQDVAPILDFNKSFHLDGDGYTPSRDLRHVAKIPLVIVQLWMDQYGVDVFNADHKPAVRRLLNSSEWSYLRTGGGKL